MFGAGSLACGLAGGIALLVVARTVQGGGAALLLPGTLAAITRTFPGERERARAIGVWPRCPGSRFPSARWPGTPPRRAGRSGIAAFGALAGSPAARSFLAGMHLAALIAALLYVAAAAASVALIPRAATSR